MRGAHPSDLRNMVSVRAITPRNIQRSARNALGQFTTFQAEINNELGVIAEELFFQQARKTLADGMARTGRKGRPDRKLRRALTDSPAMVTNLPGGSGIRIDPTRKLDDPAAGVASYWRAIESGHPGAFIGAKGLFQPSGTRPGQGLGDAAFQPGPGAPLTEIRPTQGYGFLMAGARNFQANFTDDLLYQRLSSLARRQGLRIKGSPRGQSISVRGGGFSGESHFPRVGGEFVNFDRYRRIPLQLNPATSSPL